MRKSGVLAWLATAVLIATPAFAAWQDYTYPELGFLVTFPADPKTETGTYRGPDGTTLPSKIFTVEQDGFRFQITVVDFSSTTATMAGVIKAAVNDYLKRGELVEDTFARIGSEWGRNLNIAGKDGGRTVASVYFTTARKLYLIEGDTLPGSKDPESGLPTRFRESLSFVNANNDAAPGGRGGGGRGGRGGRGGAAPAPQN